MHWRAVFCSSDEVVLDFPKPLKKMGSGASVQRLPTTHVQAATDADVAGVVSDLSAAERQKLQQALAILETEGSHEPKMSPYPSLLGSTRLPQLGTEGQRWLQRASEHIEAVRAGSLERPNPKRQIHRNSKLSLAAGIGR